MLQLRDIKKTYITGDSQTEALKGLTVNFRKNEFVAVLGPSGCGKTTLLNVIGGLDKYDSGSLTINGTSTYEYTDSDWDSYRNRSIGFVFQTYNLIPHQTVLANVQLALTLSGVSKSEQKERAIEALRKVGIEDQANKKPNQLSGGQMQRVAIARALINDPEIVLADEPTGALDSDSSAQIMALLKEISKEKLVITVTHNSEIAEKFASRIITLKDGTIEKDSNEYTPNAPEKPQKFKNKPIAKTPMSFLTAFSLSMNNLLTKKLRTALTSIAGSIGIIGIALILSLSNGFKGYISIIQENTLSVYPIQVSSKGIDYKSIISELSGQTVSVLPEHDLNKVYARPVFGQLLDAASSGVQNNNLSEFKNYIDENGDLIEPYVTDVKYTYGVKLDVYAKNTNNGIIKVNPMDIFSELTGSDLLATGTNFLASATNGFNVWYELLQNQELLESQYETIVGEWPDQYNEIVLFVDENNEINDYVLCALGLADQYDILKGITGNTYGGYNLDGEMKSYDYSEILGLKFGLVPASSKYVYDESKGIWVDKSNDQKFMRNLISNSTELKIVGIMRQKDSSSSNSLGMIGYTHALTEYCIAINNQSEIVKAQKSQEINQAAYEKYGVEYKNCEIDMFTGIPFDFRPLKMEISIETIKSYIATLSEEQQKTINMLIDGLTEEAIIEYFTMKLSQNSETTESTLKSNLIALGAAELETPVAIGFYAKDFESKDKIAEFIENYNKSVAASGTDNNVIGYTDYASMVSNTIGKMVDGISYILIAFVAVSLIVSSIMIGIITYISVLERTKEIGILRSIGASRRDITRVFNAETAITGATSGILGILLTILLNLPINLIANNLAGINRISILPVYAAVILVAISISLTFFAGIIPAKIAAKKNPVVALRTE